MSIVISLPIRTSLELVCKNAKIGNCQLCEFRENSFTDMFVTRAVDFSCELNNFS